MNDQIGVQFPDIATNLNSLEVRYVTGEVPWEQLELYIRNTYAPAVSGIQALMADHLLKNPARYEYQ